MPVVHFTDLSIRALKASSEYVTYWDRALPAFGVRVGKHTKTFVVLHGKRRTRRSLGRYPAVSLKKAREAAVLILHGSETVTAAPDPLPASKAAKLFFETHRPHNKERTKKETKRVLDRHFLALHADTPIGRITTTDVVAITDKLLRTPAEAIHVHAALKTFFNWALHRHLIERSPLAGLPLPARPTTRSRVLSDGELVAVYLAAERLGYPFGTIVILCILTAQRRSEIASLKWSYIRPETITLPALVCKNNREHVFPNTVGGILKTIPQTSPYLFPSARGYYTSWTRGKRRLDALAAVGDHYVLHDLRRTFSSKCAEWRIAPPHIVERILNHTNPTSLGGQVGQIYNRHEYLPEMRDCLHDFERHLLHLIGQSRQPPVEMPLGITP